MQAMILSSVAFAAFATAPAAPPADHWKVDVSLGKCGLERAYTQPEAALLSIETEVGSDSYYLKLATERASSVPAGFFPEAAIKVDGKTRATTYIEVGKSNGPLRQQLGLHLAGATIDAMAGGSEFSVAMGRNSTSIPLPDAGKAIAALRSCEADQLTEWGADPAQFKPGGARPKVGDRNEIVSQALIRTIHFPKGPIEPLHYVLLSNAGVVEHCEAVYGIPGSDMEQVVCKSLTGKKLGEPARDPEGKPVRGVVTFSPAMIRRARVQISS